MKISSVSELKKEFNHLSTIELVELLNNLIKFNKENKEYVHYLLLESNFEANYIQKIKDEIEIEFKSIDARSWKTMKKSIQRIATAIYFQENLQLSASRLSIRLPTKLFPALMT
jgi:hypothetical protein